MEFTYDGLVRWGFGFHNPNHAAAAICAVLPFVWGLGRAGARPSPWVAVARWLLTGGLFAALRPIALADEPVKSLRGEKGLMYLNGTPMAIDDIWANGTASAAYWPWEQSKEK